MTVTVERLTGEAYEEDDLSGLPDLVEVIKLQATGPTEASRAIRKKLKYGSAHRQLRALVILDGLIQNAGPRFQRAFADEMLLERLRVCGTSDLSDPDVKKKCSELFRNWANEYKNTPGMERVARLYKVSLALGGGWAHFSTHCVTFNTGLIKTTGTPQAQTSRHTRTLQSHPRNRRQPLRRRRRRGTSTSRGSDPLPRLILPRHPANRPGQLLQLPVVQEKGQKDQETRQ